MISCKTGLKMQEQKTIIQKYAADSVQKEEKQYFLNKK